METTKCVLAMICLAQIIHEGNDIFMRECVSASRRRRSVRNWALVDLFRTYRFWLTAMNFINLRPSERETFFRFLILQ